MIAGLTTYLQTRRVSCDRDERLSVLTGNDGDGDDHARRDAERPDAALEGKELLPVEVELYLVDDIDGLGQLVRDGDVVHARVEEGVARVSQTTEEGRQ